MSESQGGRKGEDGESHDERESNTTLREEPPADRSIWHVPSADELRMIDRNERIRLARTSWVPSFSPNELTALPDISWGPPSPDIVYSGEVLNVFAESIKSRSRPFFGKRSKTAPTPLNANARLGAVRNVAYVDNNKTDSTWVSTEISRTSQTSQAEQPSAPAAPTPAKPPVSAAIDVKGWRQGVLVASVMMGLFLGFLDTTIVAVALPSIANDFDDFSNITWVVTAYLLSYMGGLHSAFDLFHQSLTSSKLSLLSFLG